MRNAFKILIGKPEGKRPLRITRRRWEDNIKTDINETDWEVLDWIKRDKVGKVDGLF
jgi:hypothetical protein